YAKRGQYCEEPLSPCVIAYATLSSGPRYLLSCASIAQQPSCELDCLVDSRITHNFMTEDKEVCEVGVEGCEVNTSPGARSVEVTAFEILDALRPSNTAVAKDDFGAIEDRNHLVLRNRTLGPAVAGE